MSTMSSWASNTDSHVAIDDYDFWNVTDVHDGLDGSHYVLDDWQMPYLNVYDLLSDWLLPIQ